MVSNQQASSNEERPISPISAWIISFCLFIAAFIPRLLDLGRFLTADEFLWIDRSRNFLAGLTNPAYQCTTVVEKWEFAEGLACTLRTGHPGVTTMWTGSFGLWLRWLADPRRLPIPDYLLTVRTNPVDASLIAPERFASVLIISLWVVALFWLARRLFGTTIALLGALFIALDPFHIALSRVIHHDALSTVFMTLAALTALIYWGQNEGRRWLLLSGIFAGFGFLSKSPALYLMPFVALVGLWFTFRAAGSKNAGAKGARSTLAAVGPLLTGTVLDGLLWFVVAMAVVFIFWPAMWVVPLEALETVFFVGSKYASGGHAKGNFFMGEISSDPGPLFYPVSWLFRASPLVLIGVALFPVSWLLDRRANKAVAFAPDRTGTGAQPSFTTSLPLILAFIMGYYLLMTWGEKKQERYFLPVYPWLNFVAAASLVSISTYLLRRVRRQAAQYIVYLLLPLILVINGYLLVQHYPYYFTYYNPLLGGPERAAKVLTIGWGEGMDLAADFLNHQVSPTRTRVSSWYQSTLAPFYYGPAISYSKEKGKALAGDYVVFYVNQVQRGFPDEVMFDYFTNRFLPVHVVRLHGIDYAWIYPSFGIDHYVEDQSYTGIASLLAWQWNVGDVPLPPGEAISFDLYWEYLGKALDEPFFVRLLDAQDRLLVEGESILLETDNPPLSSWREGEIIYESGSLQIPTGTPPGQYRLEIGLYTKAEAIPEGELLFALPPAEALVTVGHVNLNDYHLPAEATYIGQPLGDALTLFGAAWPNEPLTPGDPLSLELYWRVEQPLPAEAAVHLGLMNETGEAKQAWFDLSLAEVINPDQSTWLYPDLIITRWQLDVLPDVPAGTYQLEVVLPEEASITIPFGSVVVER